MRNIKDVVSIDYVETRNDGSSIVNRRTNVIGEHNYVVLSYMNNSVSTLAKDLKDDGFSMETWEGLLALGLGHVQ